MMRRMGRVMVMVVIGFKVLGGRWRGMSLLRRRLDSVKC